MGGASDHDLEEFFCCSPALECCERHTASVVVYEVVIVVKVGERGFDFGDRHFKDGQRSRKVSCGDADSKKNGMYSCKMV